MSNGAETNEKAPITEKVATLGNITITNASKTPISTPPRESCVVELSRHDFKETTFHAATHCHVCNETLPGLLWKQGLQCSSCGIIVHPMGGGSDEKTYECCTEAMLTECKPKSSVSPDEEERLKYEETVTAVNKGLAKESDRAGEENDKGITAQDEVTIESETNDTSQASIMEEEASTLKQHPTADSSILPQISRLLPQDYAEQAHMFETTSFTEPTYCNICDGVLAGVWSQGKQCKTCGLIVHHGQGAGKHSNCHAEAMVKPCTKKQVQSSGDKEESRSTKGSETTGLKSVASTGPPSGAQSKAETKQNIFATATAAASSLPLQILPSLSSEDEHEMPHKFVEHSYASPTYCGICNGLLVGLWSQGFHCEVCGLNVHRGEGIDDHDDCKGEALLSVCPGKKAGEERAVTLTEAIKKSPNFFQEVKEQMDRDLMTHVKEAVIAGGVEGERSKNLRRFRERLVPKVEALDAIEARGEAYSIFYLLRLHLVVAFIVSGIGLLVFILALCPKLGFGLLDASVFHLAVMHELTILGTIHLCLVAVAFALYYFAIIFRRKSVIIEEYLMDMFGINAEEDIGISVVGASIRLRTWSRRITLSATITCVFSLVAWIYWQPTLDELRRALSEDYIRAEHLSPGEL